MLLTYRPTSRELSRLPSRDAPEAQSRRRGSLPAVGWRSGTGGFASGVGSNELFGGASEPSTRPSWEDDVGQRSGNSQAMPSHLLSAQASPDVRRGRAQRRRTAPAALWGLRPTPNLVTRILFFHAVVSPPRLTPPLIFKCPGLATAPRWSELLTITRSSITLRLAFRDNFIWVCWSLQ
jgi:hypothetical protein